MLKRLAPLLGSNYHYPAWNRAMELGGIGVYALFASLVAIRLSSSASIDLALWLLPVTAAAFFAAAEYRRSLLVSNAGFDELATYPAKFGAE